MLTGTYFYIVVIAEEKPACIVVDVNYFTASLDYHVKSLHSRVFVYYLQVAPELTFTKQTKNNFNVTFPFVCTSSKYMQRLVSCVNYQWLDLLALN